MPLNKIVMKANKDLLGEYLLCNENNLPKMLFLEELEPIFDRCKELNSPNLRDRMTSSKYFSQFSVMDGITKLKSLIN